MTSQAMSFWIGVLFDRNFEFNKKHVQGKYKLTNFCRITVVHSCAKGRQLFTILQSVAQDWSYISNSYWWTNQKIKSCIPVFNHIWLLVLGMPQNAPHPFWSVITNWKKTTINTVSYIFVSLPIYVLISLEISWTYV